MSCIKDATPSQFPQANLEIASGLDDLLLHELQERIIPISIKELQAQISLTRPMKVITVAASLDKLYRKGRVIRRLIGDGRTHYVYSLISTQEKSQLPPSPICQQSQVGVLSKRKVNQLPVTKVNVKATPILGRGCYDSDS